MKAPTQLRTRLALAVLCIGGAVERADGQSADTLSWATYDSAAARVRSVRIAPSPLYLAVGDTAKVGVVLLDEAHRPVTVRLPSGTVAPPQYYLVSSGFMYLDAGGNVTFGGQDAPSTTLRLVGHIPSRSAKIMVSDGAPGKYRTFEVPIVVGERATSRMELHRPPYLPLVGGSMRISATVWKRGATYPDASPDIAWSSTNPSVASVAPNGTVSLRRPGIATITATNGGARASLRLGVRPSSVARVTLHPDHANVRTGDVVHLNARAFDSAGRSVRGAPINLAVSAGAVTFDDGTFVAEEPGAYTVVAALGGAGTTVTITARPRGVGAQVEALAHIAWPSLTTELMVFEGKDGRDYAYVGGARTSLECYDVTDPRHPVVVDSVNTDSRYVNDVRVDSETGPSLAVFTKESTPNRRNGVVLLDVSRPAHPVVLSEFTETTAGGVHNAWIAGHRVYLANDGTGDLHILDITDPRHPKESGRWSVGAPGHYLHDMIVQDGIAYLAYWDDGLIILDVGGGGKGGTPDRPVFISRYAYGPGGHTHHVFRYKQYVFVGDEGPVFVPRPANGPSGYVHVVDVSDLERPREVAKYQVPEAGAHNSWIENDTLYTAYYQGGLRVVDVSGELRGDLYRQGRQIAWFDTGAGVGEAYVPNRPFGAAPQYYKGNIFFADFYSGFWIFKLTPTSSPSATTGTQ
jgi:hypothetical protein